MTPEAQRITIAKVRGWRYAGPADMIDEAWACWLAPEAPDWEFSFPPDYLGDLNAMHEAEMTLPPDKRDLMASYLAVAMAPEGLGHIWGFATAAQRAEAFLRTLNLWDDIK